MPFGIAHEHVGPSARAAQRPRRYRQVVVNEIELRVPGVWKKDLARIRYRNLATLDDQQLAFGGLRHRRSTKLLANDQLQTGPCVVDRTYLDVDKPQWKRKFANRVFRDVGWNF